MCIRDRHDAMQCGIACLRMICAFLGKNYSIDSLSKICFASKDGVSLLGISEAAGELGLKTTCGKMSIDQLAKVELPVILHWNQNQFCSSLQDQIQKREEKCLLRGGPGKWSDAISGEGFCGSLDNGPLERRG